MVNLTKMVMGDLTLQKSYLGLHQIMSKFNLAHHLFLFLTFIMKLVSFILHIFSSDIAKDEVDHLFASADDDHDDLLSFEEILEHNDVFVGSEATDYGDHLHNMHLFDEL